MKKQLIIIVIALLAFCGSCPQFLHAQTSVPVIQVPGANDPVLNANSNGSTLSPTLGKSKSKRTSGFKKGKKVKTKKSSRYYKKGTKSGKGKTADTGSEGSQTEVSNQRDVSNQADSSKK
jgi:hypothetical protein